jgi:LuxR family maltose regulon positive regulatory protein
MWRRLVEATLIISDKRRNSTIPSAINDYPVIVGPQLHDAIACFFDHQPTHVHLALTTRVDPPPPLARLYARGQLTEVRAQHLRFTPEEVSVSF